MENVVDFSSAKYLLRKYFNYFRKITADLSSPTLSLVSSVLVSSILAGCSNGIPEVSFNFLNSAADIQMFNINGSKEATFEVGSSSKDLVIAGECDKRISNIQGSKDNGATWFDFSQSQSTSSNSDLDCTDQNFKIYFTNVKTYLGFSGSDNQSVVLLLRSASSRGSSQTITLTINYIPSMGLVKLTNLPTNPSNSKSLAVVVSGEHLMAYKYKLGGKSSTDCSDSSGYSSEKTPEENIADDLQALSDGQYKLCVVGYDGEEWQTFSHSTEYSWEKDTVAPVITNFQITNSSPIENPNINLNISADNFNSYCILVNSATTAECSWINLSLIPSNFTLAEPFGNKYLTLIVKDLAGNVSNSISSNTVFFIPKAPSNISRISSLKSIDSVTNPVFEVSDIYPGYGVSLYTDSSCSSINKIGTNSSVDPSLIINNKTQITTTLTNDGLYTVYADIIKDGVKSQCSTSFASYQLLRVIVQPVYLGFSNWNDYISYNDSSKDKFHQNATLCSGSEVGYYNKPGGCLHTGEMKKIPLNGIKSCNNLSITDSTGVFNWVCAIDSSNNNTATFYTTDIIAAKGLRDLIAKDSSTNTFYWKKAKVDILSSGTVIASSTLTEWWLNSQLQPAPLDNENIINLSSPGIIYVFQDPTINALVSSTASAGINISSDKIGLVTLGTSPLNYTSSIPNCSSNNNSTLDLNATICRNGTSTIKHLWVEITSEGSNVHSGLWLSSVKFSRFNNILIQNTANTTPNSNSFIFNLNNSSSSNLITNLSIYNTLSGILVRNSSVYNTFLSTKIAKTNAPGPQLSLQSNSNFTKIYDIQLTETNMNDISSSFGIYILANNNSVVKAKISNIGGGNSGSKSDGIFLDTSYNNVISQLTTFNSNGTGIYVSGGLVGANQNIFSHITSTNNKANGLYLSGASNSNIFNSIAISNNYNGILFDNSTVTSTPCQGSNNQFNNLAIANNISVPLEGACGTTGTIFSSLTGYTLFENANGSRASVNDQSTSYLGTDLRTSFGANNYSDYPAFAGNGLLSYSNLTALKSIDAWLGLNSFYQGWGLYYDAAFNANPNFAGRCSGSSNCQIWDWRVRKSGSLYNRSVAGNAPQNSLSTSGTCDSNIISNTSTITSSGNVTFLMNAVEIMNDEIGNDNGLCESGESCIFAPNIGSYQGDGGVSAGYCLVPAGGNISQQIKIYQYLNNGI